MPTSYIVPIDRKRKLFATTSGLHAARSILEREYNAHAQHDWEPKRNWVDNSLRQLLDMAVKGTSIEDGVVGTVDCKKFPCGDELVFVATDVRGPGNWISYAKQVCPDGIVCAD